MEREATISRELIEFFWTEIRNANQGGTSPATLGSALDSWEQAPADVLACWTGLRSDPADANPATPVEISQLDQIKAELDRLASARGLEAELEGLV